MKKILTALSRLTSVALIAGILASCSGGEDSTSSGSSSKAASGKTESNTSSTAYDTSKNEAQKASFDKYGHYGNADLGYETMSGERDPWTWPFSRDSIWNMPLGSNAKYEHVGFEFYDAYGFDEEYIWTTDENDEQLEIVKSTMHDRWPDDVTNYHRGGKIYWPRGVTISKELRGNCCSAILQPDGRYIIQLQPTCRDTTDANYVVGIGGGKVDIYDLGYFGSHYGSYLSTLGGSIRLGELTNDEDIHHSLKLDVFGKTCLYFDWETMGYTWPAKTADSGASEGAYAGKNPNVRMGSLLAIDPNVTAESLGITTKPGKKIFKALQDYGCYIVDDSAWEEYNFCGDIAVIDEVKKAYGININGNYSMTADSVNRAWAKDLKAMIENLKVITNNSKATVGGGGTPRRPLAPNLPSLK